MRETLVRLLEKRGYELRGKSNTGKIVEKFEREEISKRLFNLMKSEQVFRLIGYFLFKRSIMNINDLVTKISKSNLSYTLNESLVKKAICNHCKSEILFPKYDQPPNIPCQKCGRRDYRIEDDWKLEMDIYGILVHYLNKLKNERILSKNLEAYCPACLTGSEYFDEDKIKEVTNIRKLFCNKCKNFKEIKWVYTPPETISNLWEKNGAWLEWYVKNLLLQEKINVIQGIKIRSKNKREIEIDCILARSNKIISIECRSKNFDKTYDEEPGISKLFPFSDWVIFVTTTKVGDSLRSQYEKISPECKKIFVDGNEIEKLPEIIKKIK
jgi:Zn finger protein HypA/HybF involved in hydrogenase expression